MSPPGVLDGGREGGRVDAEHSLGLGDRKPRAAAENDKQIAGVRFRPCVLRISAPSGANIGETELSIPRAAPTGRHQWRAPSPAGYLRATAHADLNGFKPSVGEHPQHDPVTIPVADSQQDVLGTDFRVTEPDPLPIRVLEHLRSPRCGRSDRGIGCRPELKAPVVAGDENRAGRARSAAKCNEPV